MRTKITPKLPSMENQIIVADMASGDYFICGDGLYVKCPDSSYQRAVNVKTGEIENDMCEYDAIPVDVEIKWTRKVEKKEKK